MTDPIATYSFLPWLRRGIANTITASDGADVSERATVPVDLQITASLVDGGSATLPVHRDVQLYGPGDVVGLDRRAIVRMEPRPGVTDFEPNYLPFVEFYDEGLPWYYTPAAVDPYTKRLRPWLTLVVLAEDEFEQPKGGSPGAALPFVVVSDLTLFPPAGELWAWAHVHVNRSLAPTPTDYVTEDVATVLAKLDAVLGDDPDLASSRLMCPRRLAPDTAYTAFVMPTFETGRLAGLGLDPAGAPTATASAWEGANRQSGDRFCYYHRWSFRTGRVGDFEYLVRLLTPRPADPRVGRRDMDVQRPAPDVPGITDPDLGGVLRLGGALRVPQTGQSESDQRYENWDKDGSHPFQKALAGLVNLAADYASGTKSDPDPLVTPPLYGQWHALTDRLLPPPPGPTPPATTGNWVHKLNLDPRFRVAAGFGTRVVQRNQEDYMAAAWQQVGAIVEANRRIRSAQFARAVATTWHARQFAARLATEPGRVLALTAPVLRRVLAVDVTVAHLVRTSAIGATPMSTALRRITRPGARLIRRLPFTSTQHAAQLLARMAVGEVTAARPKAAPGGIGALDEAALGLRDLLDQNAIGDRIWLLLPGDRRPEVVDRLPHVPGFVLRTPARDPVHPEPGDRDSDTGIRFKTALLDATEVVATTATVSKQPVRPPLPVNNLAATVLKAIHPALTVPRKALSGLYVPERLRTLVVEKFVEAMAYPEIDIPMYEPLVAESSELFLPNLNLVEQNSITLLETDQRFIESYLVGLNHEFARELLWREYPTDQRGSYFRQFWNPTAQQSPPGETAAQRRERLRDIPPVHLWSLGSALGTHDHREPVPGTAGEEVVLVIRGELLKRYPTAVIYAHRAKWKYTDGGEIDPTAERELVELSEAQEADPAGDLRMPLYEAKVDPDIYFFGFPLTVSDARGDDLTDDVPPGQEPKPGWFFVIRERPGEPRFGFDVDRTGGLNVWNDLAWTDVLPDGARFAPAGAPDKVELDEPTGDDSEKHPQWEEDKNLHWYSDLQSSEIAYITYQAPVLVAVHAREMLSG